MLEKYITQQEAQEIFLESFYLYKNPERAIEVLSRYKDILNKPLN